MALKIETDNTQHVPTPWKIIDHDEDHISITDEEQMYGACRVELKAVENRKMMKATAAHIFKCVSLHDKLVDALEEAISCALSGSECSGYYDLLERAKGKL